MNYAIISSLIGKDSIANKAWNHPFVLQDSTVKELTSKFQFIYNTNEDTLNDLELEALSGLTKNKKNDINEIISAPPIVSTLLLTQYMDLNELKEEELGLISNFQPFEALENGYNLSLASQYLRLGVTENKIFSKIDSSNIINITRETLISSDSNNIYKLGHNKAFNIAIVTPCIHKLIELNQTEEAYNIALKSLELLPYRGRAYINYIVASAHMGYEGFAEETISELAELDQQMAEESKKVYEAILSLKEASDF